MHIYVCIYSIHMCICGHVRMYISTYIHTYIHMCVSAHICTYCFCCVHAFISTYVHSYTVVFVPLWLLPPPLQVISSAFTATDPASGPTQSPPKEAAPATSRQPSAGERSESAKPTHIAFGRKVEIPEHVLKARQVRTHSVCLYVCIHSPLQCKMNSTLYCIITYSTIYFLNELLHGHT